MTSVRDRILRVARNSMAGGHTLNTQVQEICRQARVSRTSFYREFRNLNDVVAALAILRWRRVLERLVASHQQGEASRAGFRAFVLDLLANSQGESAYLDGGEGMHQVLEAMYSDTASYLDPLTGVLIPFVKSWQQQGVVRSDVPAACLTDYLMRQIWSLTSVPFPVQGVDQDLTTYLDCFVLPVVFAPVGQDRSDSQVLNKLDTLAQTLQRIEHRLPAQPMDA